MWYERKRGVKNLLQIFGHSNQKNTGTLKKEEGGGGGEYRYSEIEKNEREPELGGNTQCLVLDILRLRYLLDSRGEILRMQLSIGLGGLEERSLLDIYLGSLAWRQYLVMRLDD